MTADNVLVSLEGSCLLFQVQAGVQTQLGTGTLVLVAPADDTPIITKVGEFQWRVDRSTPCLRSDDHTYTFAIPEPSGHPPLFYCLILPPDAAHDTVELLQSVLASTTAYSGNAAAAAGAEAGAPPGSEGHARGPEVEHAGGGGSSVLPETLMKGATFLSSSFRWAAGAASAGISAAKEKAEASLTPETRAKLDSAKTSAWNSMEKVGTFAGKVASDVKTSTTSLVAKVADSEFARSESVRTASRVSRDVLSTVYHDMQKAGDIVVAAAKEAAAKVRGEPGPGAAASAGSESAEHAVPVSVPGHPAPPAQAPATGIPVSAQFTPVSAPEGHYPAVPPA